MQRWIQRTPPPPPPPAFRVGPKADSTPTPPPRFSYSGQHPPPPHFVSQVSTPPFGESCIRPWDVKMQLESTSTFLWNVLKSCSRFFFKGLFMCSNKEHNQGIGGCCSFPPKRSVRYKSTSTHLESNLYAPLLLSIVTYVVHLEENDKNEPPNL